MTSSSGFFPAYSQSNCILECSWRLAKDRCGCVPWFLKRQFVQEPVCELFGNRCFKDLVDKRYKSGLTAECREGCFPDCELTEYKILGSSDPVRPRNLINDISNVHIFPT